MAKIVDVKQPDAVVTVEMSDGQRIEGTVPQLKAAVAVARALHGEPGHNSGDTPTDVSGKRLKSFLERIERLEQEKAGMAEDIKEVYAEAKGTGFEPRIMRRLIKLRAMDVEKRREEDELLELYKGAVGMD